MTSVRILWLLLCLIWVGAEILLARKRALDDSRITDSEQRSQGLLWLSVMASLGLALLFKNLDWAHLPIKYLPRQWLAMLLFAVGLYLRYLAVVRLGRFFTTHLAIQHEHRLITDGPYRWLRHPAYTGLLIALAGAGLAMGDAIALLILIVPTFLAFKTRIELEEKMLDSKFGDEYRAYSKTTWKLLPWLY